MEEIFDPSNISGIKPIRDIVYEELKAAIVNGKIKQGQRIIEKEYAQRMNISRTPVREALRKLEIEGFVEYLPRKGVVVKSFSNEDIVEIYDIRDALESLAMKYVIENITEAEIKILKQSLEDMDKARAKRDVFSVFEACKVFNETILNSSKKPRLINIVSTLEKYISLLRNVTMKDDFSRIEDALIEHREIFDAIEKKDVISAQQAIKRHNEASKNTFFSKLEKLKDK
ncbi:MAG: GntR family transcriptional regulator [Firmicutes bacterium]|nr:GntR family transcriptional regulator [Bacillota bacterium]